MIRDGEEGRYLMLGAAFCQCTEICSCLVACFFTVYMYEDNLDGVKNLLRYNVSCIYQMYLYPAFPSRQ